MKTPQARARAVPLAASADPVREAFVKRAAETIARIAAQADPKLLVDALAAATGVGALALVLADSAAVGASVIDLDPLAPLAARNAEHRLQRLTQAGGALSSTQVASLLGVSRQAVEKRRRAGSLLAVRSGGDWLYPRCQFDEATGEAIEGLPKLLAALGAISPWVALDFLLAPDSTLGDATPLEALRRDGMSASLARLARIEQGDGFA